MYWFEMLPEMPEAFFTGLQEVMIMAFFDSMKETLTTAGRDVSQKAKEVSGVAKLKLDIKSKEDALNKEYIAEIVKELN